MYLPPLKVEDLEFAMPESVALLYMPVKRGFDSRGLIFARTASQGDPRRPERSKDAAVPDFPLNSANPGVRDGTGSGLLAFRPCAPRAGLLACFLLGRGIPRLRVA